MREADCREMEKMPSFRNGNTPYYCYCYFYIIIPFYLNYLF